MRGTAQGHYSPSNMRFLDDSLTVHGTPPHHYTSGLQDSVAGLEVCSRCRSSLPQGPLHSRCIRRRPPAPAICRYWSSTGFTRSDRAAEFRRQWTYHLEQSATSTTFARSVAEHLQAGTEDASLLIRPATLESFSRLCRCL